MPTSQYDVVRTTRDESGLLLYKGNEALLSAEEAQGTWTYTGVGLTDGGAVEHLIDAGDQCIRVAGRRMVRMGWLRFVCMSVLSQRCMYVRTHHRHSNHPHQVPAERWTHVAVVHNDDSVRIFYDGLCVTDSPTPLPLHLRRPCHPRFRTIMQRIESPHPYPNNMSESWTVSIPGATSFRLTFDPRTKYVVL